MPPEVLAEQMKCSDVDTQTLVCTSLGRGCRRFQTRQARNSRWRRRWPRWKGNGNMWVLDSNWYWYRMVLDGTWIFVVIRWHHLLLVRDILLNRAVWWWQIWVNCYLVSQPLLDISGVEGDMWRPIGRGKVSIVAHFLLQRSHTVYCLFLFPHLHSGPPFCKNLHSFSYFPATNPISAPTSLFSSALLLLLSFNPPSACFWVSFKGF